MKVKTASLYKVAIIMILILDVCAFYLVQLPESISQYNSTYNKTLIGALSVILAFICFFRHQERYNDYGFVKKYCAFCISLAILLLFHGTIKYPSQGIMSLLRGCDFLFLVLLAIPILYVLMAELDFEGFMNTLNYITLIWYFVLILQSVVYSANGNVFLLYGSSADKLWIRNGRIRYPLFALGNLMIFYNFYILILSGYKKKKKIISFIAFILGVYSNLFIQQTRALEFTMVLTIAVMYLLQSNNKMKVLRNYAVVLIGVIILLASGILNDFFSSFTAGETVKNTLVRQEAIVYYLQYWKQHPLVGMGVTNSELLTRGPQGVYYMSDVGIIGLMAKCGIFAILLNIMLMFRWVKIILRIRKTIYYEINILLIGLLLYFFVPSYTISFFAPAYAITVPIIISIFEFWNYMAIQGGRYEQ